MTRSHLAVSVAALTLSALPLAAEEGQTLPAWVEKPLESVSPYVGAASDVYGGASGAIDATKALRNSDIARDAGNKAVRHAQAMEYNLARKTAKGYVDGVERYKLGPATTIADVGSTLTAHVLEGDYRSVPGVVANAAVKNAVTSGGAWAVGTAGAAAGSFFGPVGTLVGGAVGAGLGALGFSMGYDAAGDALKANGYQDVQGYVDSLMAEDARAAFRQAQQNRREWLVEHGLAPVVGGDPDFAKPRPEPVSAEAPADPPERDPNAAPSLIPDDCTIELVLDNPRAEGAAWRGTVRVSGPSVTGRGETTYPATSGSGHRQESFRWTSEIGGTRSGNVLTLENRYRLARARLEHWWNDENGLRRTCIVDTTGSGVTREEWTFHPGGRGTMHGSGRTTITTQSATGCVKPGTESSTTGGSGEPVAFTWRLR